MNEIQADEAGYERGWEQAEDYWRAKEQERIIKRLEQAALDWAQSDFNVSLITNGLIALIKGENK